MDITNTDIIVLYFCRRVISIDMVLILLLCLNNYTLTLIFYQ